MKGSWVDVEGEPALEAELSSRGHEVLGRKPLKACEPVASFSDRRRLSRTEIWRLALGVCPYRFSTWSWDRRAGADGPGSSREHGTALELLQSQRLRMALIRLHGSRRLEKRERSWQLKGLCCGG